MQFIYYSVFIIANALDGRHIGDDMATWFWRFFGGAVAGSALLIGSAIGYSFPMKQRTVAGVMAFGAGVLITTLSFELMEETHTTGGLLATAAGFCIGALVYTGANIVINSYGARHRKHSKLHHHKNISAASVALGPIIDAIPESMIIGISLLESTSISILTIVLVCFLIYLKGYQALWG